MTQGFDHTVRPTEGGWHPRYPHLALFEIEHHYGSYILTSSACEGSGLISADDAKEMFGEQYDDGFAYLPDDYLDLVRTGDVG